MRFLLILSFLSMLGACSNSESFRNFEQVSEEVETAVLKESNGTDTERSLGTESEAAVVQVDYPRINGKLIDRCAVYDGKASCARQATSDVSHATCRRLGMRSGASYTWKLEPPQQVFWWNFVRGKRPQLVTHPDSNTRKGVLIVLKCYQ